MVNTKALFFSLLYNEELLCVFRYKKKKRFSCWKKRIIRYTKRKSRLQSRRRRLLLLSVCVGFCPRLLSLFLGRRQKKDSPSFCKGAVVERDTLDALKSTHAQGNTTNNTNRGVKESDPHTKKTREEKETQKKNLFF